MRKSIAGYDSRIRFRYPLSLSFYYMIQNEKLSSSILSSTFYIRRRPITRRSSVNTESRQAFTRFDTLSDARGD